MSARPEHRQRVRRVVLPSGKAIDVVYYDGRRPGAARGAELHICGACGSELVYPLDWQEAGEEHWQVTLRCPNCEWCGTGVFEQLDVERFDRELDRGTEALVRDLKLLAQANREEQIERFSEALRLDHIVPDDF